MSNNFSEPQKQKAPSVSVTSSRYDWLVWSHNVVYFFDKIKEVNQGGLRPMWALKTIKIKYKMGKYIMQLRFGMFLHVSAI